jgi:hypothetical protein
MKVIHERPGGVKGSCGWVPVRERRSGLGCGSSIHPVGLGRTRVSCGARGPSGAIKGASGLQAGVERCSSSSIRLRISVRVWP